MAIESVRLRTWDLIMWLFAARLAAICSLVFADGKEPAIVVGQKVVTKDDPTPVLRDGRVIDDGMSFHVFTVEKIEGEAVLVVGDGLRGHVLRKSLIPYDSAIEYWTRRLSAEPTAQGFVCRGVLWDERGEFDKAVHDYDEAIRLDPRCAAAFGDRGKSRLNRGEYGQAIEDSGAAIRLDPQNAIYYYNRGFARDAVGDLEGAIDDYGTSIRLSARPANAYVRRGITWERKRDDRKALADFASALESDPNNVWALNGVGWLSATCKEARLRDGGKAVRMASRACELSGWKDAIFLGTLAAAHAEAGDFAKAVEYQARASKHYKDDEDRKGGEQRLGLYKEGKPYRDER